MKSSTVVLAIGIVLIARIAPLAAQTSTRSTSDVELDGSAGAGINGTLRLPGVKVKKTLTIDAATGAATQSCKFENFNATPVSFLFCNMVQLNGAVPPVPTMNRCNLQVDPVTMSWTCFAAARADTGPPNAHFGCTVVTLAPSGMIGDIVEPPPQTITNPSFRGHHAKEFEVSYVDIFSLSGFGWNPGPCMAMGCFGPDSSTNMAGGGAGVRRLDASGFWIVRHSPITDPFVIWEDLDGVLHEIGYAALDAGLSMPSDFPLTIPGVARATPGAVPPLSYDMDLNLWDIFTMSADPSVNTPVIITPFFDNPFGVTVSVNPKFFDVAGGSMELGRLTVTRPDTAIPEGSEVYFEVLFSDPVDPLLYYWVQNGNLIQDTVPSDVIAFDVRYEDDDTLTVSVTAADATTSPVAANFWWTTDGDTWGIAPLATTANLLDAPDTVTFAATVAPERRRDVTWAINVQDTVYNEAWLGVGTADAGGCRCAVVPAPMPGAGVFALALILPLLAGVLRARFSRPRVVPEAPVTGGSAPHKSAGASTRPAATTAGASIAPLLPPGSAAEASRAVRSVATARTASTMRDRFMTWCN